MPSRRTTAALALALAGLSIAARGTGTEIVDPFAVVATLDGFARQVLWPGFDPSAQPIAIYDGKSTLLFRHPAPPEEFVPSGSHQGVWKVEGRHPAMRWNSTVDLGGVRVATLLLTIEPGRAVDVEAGILLHEVFHVFSKPRHPTWSPDEMDRYSYPLDDLENRTLLVLEEEALARALEAEQEPMAAGWATLAMRLRRQRARRLRPEHLTFENALEMQEGTAVYVARLALGTPRDTTRLRQALSPEELRWRFYDTGAALAALLDRVAPGWKLRLEEQPDLTMDVLLDEALVSLGAEPAELEPSEAAPILERAQEEITQLAVRRTEAREEFLSYDSRITVIASAVERPLYASDFDPLALKILADGEALHSRRLTLEGPTGRLELENPRFRRGALEGVLALTVPAGAHPLLGGVLRVTIAGFEGKPEVNREDGLVHVVAEGVRLRFEEADVHVDGDEIRVLLRTPGNVQTGGKG